MDVERLYVWICFFFSIALAAGGVLLFFQKREIKRIPASRFLQYFLILVYTFGFYSIWSDVLFRILFAAIKDHEAIAQLPQYLALIGTPFIITGMFMLILWAVNLFGKKPGGFFIPLVSLAVFLSILTYAGYKDFDVLTNVRQIYALFSIMTTFFSAGLLCFSASDYLGQRSRSVLVFLTLFSGAMHIPLFLNRLNTPLFELIFTFLFFFVNTCIGVYFAYYAKVPSKRPKDDVRPLSFDQFIQEYGITPRESEVVQGIYRGKTNKEIADELFLSVQTIKDHTHRIYLKTNLKNRAQLASFLRRYAPTWRS